ncbi:thioesterase family protein [Hoeflea sp.]|uniref:acyl-CoA thioesterase n=1 Tax=Hoeflea sp. TaxID=1940281 RepID=UPI0019BC79FE|nr:thioesterase family protein [Hoeflea sp.]MBC7282345.1 acyl-CoA thioesterase [Hoeflea sp.]
MSVSFTTTRMLHFGDCDISGTAYYPSYLNLLNGVNEEFWSWIGFPWHEIIWKERWGTPTVHLTCDFSKPSFFGDTLTFELTVTKVGRSSMTVEHTVLCDGEKRWTSKQVLAASQLDEHTSIPWPDAVRAKLVSFLPQDLPEPAPAS